MCRHVGFSRLYQKCDCWLHFDTRYVVMDNNIIDTKFVFDSIYYFSNQSDFLYLIVSISAKIELLATYVVAASYMSCAQAKRYE